MNKIHNTSEIVNCLYVGYKNSYKFLPILNKDHITYWLKIQSNQNTDWVNDILIMIFMTYLRG